MNRLKIFLFPFCIILFFPLLAILGKNKTDNFIDWVTEEL